MSGASKSFVLAAIRYAGMRVRLRYTSSADLCHKMTASVGFLYLGIKRLQVLYNDHYSAFAEAPFEISRREQLLLAGTCFDHICTVPDKIDGASERGRLIREKTLNFKRLWQIRSQSHLHYYVRMLGYIFFYQLQLSLRHHERTHTKAPHHRGLSFSFELR